MTDWLKYSFIQHSNKGYNNRKKNPTRALPSNSSKSTKRAINSKINKFIEMGFTFWGYIFAYWSKHFIIIINNFKDYSFAYYKYMYIYFLSGTAKGLRLYTTWYLTR